VRRRELRSSAEQKLASDGGGLAWGGNPVDDRAAFHLRTKAADPDAQKLQDPAIYIYLQCLGYINRTGAFVNRLVSLVTVRPEPGERVQAMSI